MKNRLNVALFSHMFNGHVFPTLPLCKELTARGHRVTYPTNRHFRDAISGAGAEPVMFEELQPPEYLVEEVNAHAGLPPRDPRFRRFLNMYAPYQFAEADSLLEQTRGFYERDVPDVMLYDRYYLAGRVLTNQLEIPAVQIWTHFAYYDGFANRTDGLYENTEAFIDWSSAMDGFFRTHGIKSDRTGWHLEDLNVHLIPAEFQPNRDSFDARFFFAGTVMNRAFRKNWTNRSHGMPIVLISGLSGKYNLKTNNGDYYRLMIEALEDLPCHCILSIGNEDLPFDLPKNFECNRTSSHLEILPQASLSIGAGGMGTTLEAIYHGVPALIVPVSPLSTEIAYRVEELGLGASVSREDASSEKIKRLVTHLLQDSSLKERLSSIRERLRHSAGAPEAVDRIEAYMHGL